MNKRRLIVIMTLAVFVFLGYLGGWWEGYKESSAPQSIKPSRPASIMYNSKLTGWDNQKLVWEIEAAKIWESSDSNQVYFEDIKEGAIYPEKKKEKTIYFKAGYARWEKYRQELYISGNLEAEQDGETFFTSEAVMRYRTEELYCPSTVEFYGKEIQAKADRMNLNQKKEELRLEGDVELVQKGDLVRAEGLIYWKKENKFKLIKPKEAIIKP